MFAEDRRSRKRRRLFDVQCPSALSLGDACFVQSAERGDPDVDGYPLRFTLSGSGTARLGRSGHELCDERAHAVDEPGTVLVPVLDVLAKRSLSSMRSQRDFEAASRAYGLNSGSRSWRLCHVSSVGGGAGAEPRSRTLDVAPHPSRDRSDRGS